MRTTMGEVKRLIAAVLIEKRGRLTPQELLTTFEDLYVNSMRSNRKSDVSHQKPGIVSVLELASWLGVPPEQVVPLLPKAGLLVDREGNIHTRGLTPQSMRAIRT